MTAATNDDVLDNDNVLAELGLGQILMPEVRGVLPLLSNKEHVRG